MSKAAMYSGAVQGISNVAEHNRTAPMREARLAEAKNRSELSRVKLDEYKSNAPARQTKSEIELEQAKMGLRKEQTARLGTELYGAFDRYDADGDTNHLNRFLESAKKNPAGSSAWDDWARFDPVTAESLAKAGIADAEEYLSDPELAKSKVLGTHTDGTQEVFDMNEAQKGSGYLRHADARKRQALMERAQLDAQMSGKTTAATEMIAQIRAENPGMSTLAATKAYHEATGAGKVGAGGGGGSTIERTAKQYMIDNPGTSATDALKASARNIAAPGGAEKNIEFAEEVRGRVHEAAGGDFYSADLSDPAIRRKVGEQITHLEQAAKSKLTPEDKRFARKYRALIRAGGEAGGGLSEEQTGIVDSFMHDVKQYISNNVEGVAAASSYETFNNFARNALMGATLTDGEMKAYKKAAGSLGTKLGPVLEKFNVQMKDLKSRLSAVYDTNDPMIAQYHLGGDMDSIDEVIENIDNRIAFMNQGDEPITANVPVAEDKGAAAKKLDQAAWESFK